MVPLCPLCLEAGVEHTLARNGSYPRGIPVDGATRPGWIYRKHCSRCKTSFSLLPDFVLPHHRYGVVLVVDWLKDCLQGAPCRSCEFLDRHGIERPAEDSQTCYSDVLDDERTRPGYQLLNTWARKFSDRCLGALPRLVMACVFLGCDLKTRLGEHLRRLAIRSPRVWPLGLALGLVLSVREAYGCPPGPLAEPLTLLLGLLSHERRRAPGEVPSYDGLAIAGQAPPRSSPSKETQP